MNYAIEMNPLVYTIGFLFAVALSIYGIRQIRKRRKVKTFPGTRYSISQKFGILGIIVILLPLFLVVILNLIRGGMLLFIIVLNLIPLPESAVNGLANFFQSFSVFFAITGTYYLCSILWPNKDKKV